MLTKENETKLLIILPYMKMIDAIQCAREFKATYGEWIDWHVFSNWLDCETRRPHPMVRLDPAHASGMTQYFYNGKA